MKAHKGGHTAPAAITFDGDGATTAADMSESKEAQVTGLMVKILGVKSTYILLLRQFKPESGQESMRLKYFPK